MCTDEMCSVILDLTLDFEIGDAVPRKYGAKVDPVLTPLSLFLTGGPFFTSLDSVRYDAA